MSFVLRLNPPPQFLDSPTHFAYGRQNQAAARNAQIIFLIHLDRRPAPVTRETAITPAGDTVARWPAIGASATAAAGWTIFKGFQRFRKGS